MLFSKQLNNLASAQQDLMDNPHVYIYSLNHMNLKIQPCLKYNLDMHFHHG